MQLARSYFGACVKKGDYEIKDIVTKHINMHLIKILFTATWPNVLVL